LHIDVLAEDIISPPASEAYRERACLQRLLWTDLSADKCDRVSATLDRRVFVKLLSELVRNCKQIF